MASGANGFISALAQLVEAVAWPGVVVLLLVLFRPQFAEFIRSLRSVDVQGAGMKMSLQSAAVALGAATVARTSRAPDTVHSLVDPRAITAALPDTRQQQKVQGSRVLWVDDNPQHDVWEKQALESLGITVDWATTTESALHMASRQHYDLVISDMQHPQSATSTEMDPQGGYTLLDQLRQAGQQTPAIIYTLPATATVAEALQHGATAVTTMPDQLVSATVNALSAA
jgi:CheY-like chemotaxis protein